MTQNYSVPSTTSTTVATTSPKLKIRIPTTGSDGNLMTFIHVISDTEWQTITRQEFFELVRSTPNADDHVVPDMEGATVYFVPDGEKYALMSRTFCREAERERKNNINRHQCVFKGTDQCDGWTENPSRKNYCSACNRENTSLTISLDEWNKDEEGNIVDFGSTFIDETEATVEEIVQSHIDMKQLYSAIEHLREDDQKFLIDGFNVDMNYEKLAAMYSINPRSACKRINRIKGRICKYIVKYCA